MDHEAHVRPVDAHAERHRRDDDVDALSDERVLVPGALGLAEPRMRRRGNAFGGQPRSQRIDLAPRRAVDDPGLLRVAPRVSSSQPLQRGTRQRAVDEVRPIERSDELDGIHQTELRGDVAPHPRGGRRGVGVHADPGQPLPKLRQLTVPPAWSCPHWLMQCASSTTKLTPHVASSVRKLSLPSPTSRSGQ